MLGFGLAGQLDRIGLEWVLGVQALALLGAGLFVSRIAAAPAATSGSPSALRNIADGLRATWNDRTLSHLLTVNFVSSAFNFGAFVIVLPFIVQRVYAGDAATLGLLMALFYAGAMLSNLLLFRLGAFAAPGRVFLLMQLTRLLILGFMWTQPAWWLLVAAVFAWGLNMGVTSTLSRSIVQESAPEAFRGRMMSVQTLGIMGSGPLGALLLGWVIEAQGTLNALLPAVVASGFLFVYGALTPLWHYRSRTFS